MPVSKTVIPLDDEETIRRFTEEIRRRSTPSLPSLQVQVENLESTINQRNGDSHVEHRATQTEPVTITAANGVSQARNGFLAKPKSALDSVLLQSPPESGVMAPPSTPENRPGLSNFEISQLIIDSIERLPATSTFTLGESRHAPSRSSSAGRQTITRGSSANDHVSSLMPGEQISQADRNVRNQSFTRMSFQAADSPPITAPAPVAFSAAESSTNVVKSTSPPPVPAGASASSTNTTAEISSLSVLEKSVSSSRWASPRDYPRPNPPATDPASARPPALISWNSFAGIGSDAKEKPEDVKEKPKDVKEKPKDVKEKPKDVKEKPEDVKEKPEDVKEKPEEASLGSATGAISQSTAELAVSENEQVASLVNEYTAKPTKPKDNWLPPHLRTPDYAFNDPRIVKPNRSYLNKTISSGEAPSENKKSSIEGSVTKPVAEVSSVPAQAVTSPDDPAPSEPILTPSSVIFRAVSPPAPTEGTKENREGLLYFSAWGKPEHRHKAAAKVRKAIIRLPNPTPSLVASLVWGGLIEEIHIKTSSADVLFAHAEDCQSYCDATANGIKYKKDGRDFIAFVEKGKDVDVVGGQLCAFLEQGFTRCVRAVDVLDKFTPAELRMKAAFKNRKVEGIEIGQTEAGLRFVVFRFCTISHAVAFKLALLRDEEWEHCNVHHAADPCAQATGVHVVENMA